MFKLDPSILNSNLLPVNANGEVRLRSVESFAIGGRVEIPSSNLRSIVSTYSFPASIASKIAVNSSPK